MHECLKDKCRLWQREGHKGCTLIKVLEKECLNTGEFQHTKQAEPQVDPVAKWEDVEPFSMLDLARIGIEDIAIFEFWRNKTKCSPVLKYSACEHQIELMMIGIFYTLVEAGFVRRSVQVFDPGDCFDTLDGVLMVVDDHHLDMISPPGSISVVDTHGAHWKASKSYLDAATKVKATWHSVRNE